MVKFDWPDDPDKDAAWVGPGDAKAECKLSTDGEHPWVATTGRKVGNDKKLNIVICALCGAVR